MQRVARGELPFDFGSPHPHVMILEQDGKFRIRALVVDPADVKKARAPGGVFAGDMFLPEQYYELGRPTGKIYVETNTRDELLARMRDMKWPADW